MSRPSAIERLRQLVAEEQWAVAEQLLEHLDPTRMILIDRARAAAIPRHAADRTAAAQTLIAAIAAAGHDVRADPAAELVAAITRRKAAELPDLLAALRVPYGQRLPAPATTEAPPPPPAPRHEPDAPPSSTPCADATAPAVAPEPQGTDLDDQLLVALADPRPPTDEPLGPRTGRQTTAQDRDGSLLELPEQFDDDQARNAVRTRCDSGELTCPVDGCPAPQLVLRAGPEIRAHFAHRPNTGVRHDPAESWALRAIALLQRLGHLGHATSAGTGRWETDRGSLRLIGPNGRLASPNDEDAVVIATSHLRFAHRARVADGRWLDLVEPPSTLQGVASFTAIDHQTTTAWTVGSSSPRAARKGLAIDHLARLRLARRTR